MTDLSSPLTIGDLILSNRIIMAPLTRSRASHGRVPNALMAEYYRQRASAGLIISEATIVNPMAAGYSDTPGIWSDAQVAGWKKVTQAVHHAGGLIFCQLWHVGRISHESYLNGETPVAPSAIQAKGTVSQIRPKVEFPKPRALELDEIQAIIADFKTAAINAKRAGFDGVELHSANGYLIDQFLQDGTNQRTDSYGGSIENRARFLLEIIDACIAVWGPSRVGSHLAPRGDAHDISDSNPEALFTYVAKQLNKRQIGFICTREYVAEDSIMPIIKAVFNGAVIANEGFDKHTAEAIIQQGKADAVAFGRKFIANPDLPKRFMYNTSLNKEVDSSFYFGDSTGYTDYPFLPN